ncbi:MAG: molybdate ABC transporter permease subunit [Synergistaceae bacterium]|nr:molybdate ABC transporter permease subunit [Synergistaceae bacterium]
MTSALVISLKVLAVNIPLLLILGTTLGWLLAKRTFPGRELLHLIVLLPVVLPPSVLGLYLLMVMGRVPLLHDLGLLFSFPAAALAPLLPALPIMVQAARSGFASVDSQLEDAARTLGDGEWAVFRRISFPLARRFLLAGLALSSARALGDFGVTLMIAGNIPGRTQTLPLYIYSRVESLDFALAHLAALLLTSVGLASLLLVRRMEGTGHGPLA